MADAAAADDHDALAGLHRAVQHLGVSDDARIVAAGDVDQARRDAGRYDDLVEVRALERFGIGRDSGLDLDPAVGELRRKTFKRKPVIFLAGDVRRQRKLSADPVRRFEQGHVVPAAASLERSRNAGNAGAEHGDALGSRGRGVGKLVLACGARIDQAGDHLVGEVMVEASLVAGDADIDEVGAAAPDLVDELGVRQQRPGHRNQISGPVCDDLGRIIGKIDTVACRHRDRHGRLQPAR